MRPQPVRAAESIRSTAAERTLANDQSAANGGGGTGTAATPEAKTSKGPITVAAAIAINLATSSATASIPVGVSITSGGKVAVVSGNNTDAHAAADGSSATESGSASIGVAVGINLARITTHSIVDGTVVAAGGTNCMGTTGQCGLEILAIRTTDGTDSDHELGASAVSGASGGDVSIAVSLGLNIANVDTLAQINGSATVNGGDVRLVAESVAASIATATPKAAAAGGSLGIGASVALNIIDDTAAATVVAAGTVVLATTGAVVLAASGGHSATTRAEAGASGGVALVPAIAIALSNVERRALIEGVGTQLVSLGGSLSIASRAPPAENAVVTSAKGAAESPGSAAIGIAFALTIANHTYTATTQRSITAAGDVSFTAEGRTHTGTTAIAAAGGRDAEPRRECNHQHARHRRSRYSRTQCGR